MNKRFFLLLLNLGVTVLLYAQKEITIRSNNGEAEEIIELPEGLQSDVDSLYWDWQSKNHIILGAGCQSMPNSTSVSDSVYIDRLDRIPSVIELPYNEVVKKFIELYANNQRARVSYLLAAMNFYTPIFEKALDLYDLPQELKYLPVIESSLNPKATSRQGAAGLWQFMQPTGKAYGLENNSLVDERRDPKKSTYAAARYLKDLYRIYQDWSLALAAYNCGPGNVNKAIKRAGGVNDYWAIYPYLPKETRGYVPGFIAATYIMNYYCEHGIAPMDNTLPLNSDTIHVKKEVHLQQISDLCNINIEELRSLNPQYKRDILPGNSGSYALRLPSTTVSTFIALEDSIYEYKANTYLNRRKTVAVNTTETTTKNTGNKVFHKVKKGDTLGALAKKNRVTVKQIQNWNKLKGTNLNVGQTLRVK
ncbi:MAG: transglycosylase SLT domain-containing protein [Phocaeicola sp.]